MSIDPDKVFRLFPLAAWVLLALAVQFVIRFGRYDDAQAVFAFVFMVGCYLLNPVNKWPALERLSGFCIFLMALRATFVLVVEGVMRLRGVTVIYLSESTGRWVFGFFGVTEVAGWIGLAGFMTSIILWLFLDPPPPPRKRPRKRPGKLGDFCLTPPNLA